MLLKFLIQIVSFIQHIFANLSITLRRMKGYEKELLEGTKSFCGAGVQLLIRKKCIGSVQSNFHYCIGKRECALLAKKLKTIKKSLGINIHDNIIAILDVCDKEIR